MKKNMTPEELLARIIFLLNEKRKINRELEKLLKTEKLVDSELAELIDGSETLINSEKSHLPANIIGKPSYKFNGKPNHANHIARMAIEALATKYDFNELQEIVNSNLINPWAKTLKIVVKKDQINNTGFIDPDRRYFTKHLLTSKDGVSFYVTTQWDVLHKTRTGTIPGSFIRLIDVLKKHGIEIEENNPDSGN